MSFGDMEAEFRSSMALVVEEKPICQVALGQILVECRGPGRPRFVSSLDEAASEVSVARPSVTLIDLFTINYEFEKLKQFIEYAKPGKVIVIDDRMNPAFADLAKSAGAAGYLTKDSDLKKFKRAISAADGACFAVKPPEPPDDQVQPVCRSLSARQLEVLGQLTLGKTNPEIAETLGISTGTVKIHVHTILRLIGARNRTHAALIAARSNPAPGPASVPPIPGEGDA